MIYRTAHRATYRNLNNNLGTLSYRIAQLTNQIASERRINAPSDDPTGAAKVLSTRSTLAGIKQYGNNLAVSDLWLSQSGSSIQSIKEGLSDIYSAIEQASTDSNSPQHDIILTQIQGMFEQLIMDANTPIGESYLFGGKEILTQPFSKKVEAQKVISGCQNSSKWTGKVQNYGNSTFNNRPDLPVHSQDFLVEVVRPGATDSRWYTKNSSTYIGKHIGNNYGFRLETTDPKYNNTQVKFVSGPENKMHHGDLSGDAGLRFSGGVDPTNIVFTKSSPGTNPSTANWDPATNTLTVALATNTSGATVADANDVALAINGATPPGVTATATGAGTGLVGLGETSFNNKLEAAVSGNQKSGYQVTVYLERDASPPDGTGNLITNAQSVANLLGGPLDMPDGTTANIFKPVTLIPGNDQQTTDPTAVVTPTAANIKLEAGDSYTLAQAAMNPKGSQNDLIWSIKNFTDNVGALGNNFSVEYKVPMNPFSDTPSIEYNSATNKITVNLAVDAGTYQQVFSKVYYDTGSQAYKSAEKAHEMALAAAVTTTANDVIKMVEEHEEPAPDGSRLRDLIDVKSADGSSGDGSLNLMGETKFSNGYDQPALFRVSQDGGKTWGPPMSFSASEYETGDMFYNAYLGHASLTTGLPGKGNDLVFTAKEMGTWGNDVRVEYKLPTTHPSAGPILEVGDQPWNICVTLATDDKGNVLTTANEIMAAVNSHPVASQLVTADLANYHEGGNGTVDVMKCTALAVGEPYQIDGKSIITPLGHATGQVGFSYSAGKQSNPNINYQALVQGPEGNNIGVRYTVDADPTYFSDPADAEGQYQDFTSIRYETNDKGETIMVVHLATKSLPECPDAENDRENYDKWREEFPLYSCTSARAVITTAGSVVQAIIDKNLEDPSSAVVWPSVDKWPDGLNSDAKVGPTDGVVWLSGGNETDDASQHGINLKFTADGSSLQVGDVFEVPVGWYRGDDQNIQINAGSSYRTTINTTGDQLFGANGQDNNILDMVQRVIWALEQNDTELVAKELPKIKEAITRVTTLETKVGTQQVRNQFISKNLDTARYSSESFLASIEDADFSQLITDLKNAQTVYEACLGATGLTSKVSLLNYI